MVEVTGIPTPCKAKPGIQVKKCSKPIIHRVMKAMVGPKDRPQIDFSIFEKEKRKGKQ